MVRQTESYLDIHDSAPLEFLLNVIVEPENKATSMFQLTYYTHLNREHRSGTLSIYYIQTRFSSVLAGPGFKRSHHLLKTINEKTSRFFEAGLTDFWTKEEIKNPDDPIEPEVLTMDHIGIGLVCCIVPLILASLIFLLEIIHSKVNKNR